MGAYANPMGTIGDAPSNQYFKNIPGFANPGQSHYSGASATKTAPASNPYQVPSVQSNPIFRMSGAASDPTSSNLGHGIIATNPEFPGLSQDVASYLNSQIGMGLSPYNLGVPLPGGGSSQRGQLTAGLNPVLAQLLSFFTGGTGGHNIPGLSALASIAQNGVNAVPAWQQMVQAQQQDISQNEANLREQFGSMGDLAGSPFGTAMSNYMEQTTKDQNSLLGQLQLQGILQGQLPAASDLYQGATQFGSGLQALNQQAIQNQYQEFLRTQPQNNPMWPIIASLATFTPPTTKTPTAFQSATSFISALSGAGGQTSSGAGFTF